MKVVKKAEVGFGQVAFFFYTLFSDPYKKWIFFIYFHPSKMYNIIGIEKMKEDITKLMEDLFGQNNVLYSPEKDIYKILTKTHRIVCVQGYAVTKESLQELKRQIDLQVSNEIQQDFYGAWAKGAGAYVDTGIPEDYTSEVLANTYRKVYSGDWGPTSGTATGTADNLSSKSSAGGVFVGASSSPGAFDPLRARVEAAGNHIRPMDIAVSSYAASEQAASNSPWKLEPTPAAKEKISGAVTKGIDLGAASGRFSQRYPGAAVASSKSKASSKLGSAQAHASQADGWNLDPRLICKAVDLLAHKNKLYISDFSIIGRDINNSITVKYSVRLNNGIEKEITINLFRRTFIRATHEIDQYAHLTDSLSDDDYIILRIAYILYQAHKLKSSNAMDINNSLCRITNYSETLSPTYFNF